MSISSSDQLRSAEALAVVSAVLLGGGIGASVIYGFLGGQDNYLIGGTWGRASTVALFLAVVIAAFARFVAGRVLRADSNFAGSAERPSGMSCWVQVAACVTGIVVTLGAALIAGVRKSPLSEPHWTPPFLSAVVGFFVIFGWNAFAVRADYL